MKSYTHFWLFASVFLVGTVAVAQEAGLELSAIDGLSEQTVAREENPAAMPADKIPAHEAIVERTAEREPAYTERIPPQKIAERSGEVAPSPDARWVEG